MWQRNGCLRQGGPSYYKQSSSPLRATSDPIQKEGADLFVFFKNRIAPFLLLKVLKDRRFKLLTQQLAELFVRRIEAKGFSWPVV